jgi:hypothetical protein
MRKSYLSSVFQMRRLQLIFSILTRLVIGHCDNVGGVIDSYDITEQMMAVCNFLNNRLEVPHSGA